MLVNNVFTITLFQSTLEQPVTHTNQMMIIHSVNYIPSP